MHMRIYTAKDYTDLSRKAANIISAQIIMKPDAVIGLLKEIGFLVRGILGNSSSLPLILAHPLHRTIVRPRISRGQPVRSESLAAFLPNPLERVALEGQHKVTMCNPQDVHKLFKYANNLQTTCKQLFL